MKYIIEYKMTLLGMALGAIAGYAYYYYVGCASGTCAITSDPTNSTLYGVLLGGLLLTSSKKEVQNITPN